jgi:hypothetical protein
LPAARAQARRREGCDVPSTLIPVASAISGRSDAATCKRPQQYLADDESLDAGAGKHAIIEVDLPANLNMATVRLEIHDGKEIRKSCSEPRRLKKSDVAQLVKECKGLKRKLATWQANLLPALAG